MVIILFTRSSTSNQARIVGSQNISQRQKNLAEQGQPFAVLLTFKHLEEARRYCEKNAQERAAASKSFSSP
jgi:hypothetical protein